MNPQVEYMDDNLYKAARFQGENIPFLGDNDEFLLRLTPGNGSNVLHVAAQYNNRQFISAVLNRPSHYELLCKHNSKGRTPLFLAAQFDNIDIVVDLLEAHDVDDPQIPDDLKRLCLREQDAQGDTPLHTALRYGHEDIALLILTRDFQLASLDNNVGESPAYLAAENFCSSFLQRISDIDRDGRYHVSFSGSFGQTAFHPARKLNDDIMSALIEGRENLLKGRDNNGKTVLHYAVEEKRESMVKMLLMADSSLAYIHDNDGFTPLHKAACIGFFPVIELILDLSPQCIEIREIPNGKTALHVIKMEAGFLSGCLKKTRMKELVNEVDNVGNTLLHTALLNADLESADALLQVSGINWRLKNNQGHSPMDLCKSEDEIPLKLKHLTLRWRVEGVKVHMEKFFDEGVTDVDDLLDHYRWDECLNYRGPNGDTILHIAARDGRMKIIRKVEGEPNDQLLLFGKNFKGDTPLHLAAEYGHRQIVEAIISVIHAQSATQSSSRRVENGRADYSQLWRMKSGNGDTPVHRAIRNGHSKIAVRLLREDQELAKTVNDANKSLLYLAAECRSCRVLKEILSKPTEDYSISGPDDKNPLHAAVEGKTPGKAVALQLMEKRDDLVKLVDSHGKTPLHYAAANARPSVVSQLLNIDKSTAFMYDNEGFTPLLRAAAVGYYLNMETILICCPESAELRDVSNNRTALHAIAKMTMSDFLRCIKHKNMAKLINETDKDGNTPLHRAILDADKTKVLALLKSKDVKWRIRNKQHQMPLDLCNELVKNGDETQLGIQLAVKNLERGELGIVDWTKHRFRRMFSLNNNVKMMRKDEVKTLLNNIALVATLLIAITFAALFTIPGGYNPNNGSPLLMKQIPVQIFVALDAMAMLLGIAVLLGYTTAILNGYQFYLEDIASSSVRWLRYSLWATVLTFLCGVYLMVSHVKIALWILALSIIITARLAVIQIFSK